MIYLLRYHANGVDIAVAETPETSARLEARGYYRCTRAAFRAAWELRDRMALWAMWPTGESAPLQRAVGTELR